MIMLASERNIEQVLLEFKEYATEVDVEFVRRSVRAIGRCAIKLEKASEKCIQVLLDLIQTKVNYVVQEAIIVIKDIFRKYPNRYESIIATLCANLGTLDEPEAKASMIWIIGEYADRIDNADELLAQFLESFKDENTQVQLQLLTAIVKLFLKRPKDTQEMVQNVLNLATQESDNPDLRDRGFVYWRLLSTDPEAAKSVVLAEKPLISDSSTHLDEALLSELIGNISTLASVYHRPPDSFVPKLKGLAKARGGLSVKDEEDEEPEYDNDDGSSIQGNTQNTPPLSHNISSSQGSQPPRQTNSNNNVGNLLDLDLMGPSNPVPVSHPGTGSQGAGLLDVFGGGGGVGAYPGTGSLGGAPSFGGPAAPSFLSQRPVVLSVDQGKGMQINGLFTRRDGRLVLDLQFTNLTSQPMGNFVIQFDKNSFGLAPSSTALPINPLNPGQSGETLLPITVTPNVAPPPPSTVIRVAVKNGQVPDVFFFQVNLSLHTLFTEGGALERVAYLSMWKTIPDSNERTKDIPLTSPAALDLDSTIRRLTAKNLFEIARRKVNDQDVVYLSVKLENSVYILVELTFKYALRQCKISTKTPSIEFVPLFEQGLEAMINGQ
eukprot:TRINITY_DN9195_c0_g2_i1.p1 TRINITY_DN9195_c0_g2~~TRINITY_DN9195_c0_g2_i1.p1  ORF type:complete len:605 (+),score=128.39 TRINITY_DN9195_c0_g2_i1:260-2074(+)